MSDWGRRLKVDATSGGRPICVRKRAKRRHDVLLAVSSFGFGDFCVAFVCGRGKGGGKMGD